MPSNSLLKLFLRSLSMLSVTAFAVAAVMAPKALLSPSYISGSNLHLITLFVSRCGNTTMGKEKLP